MAESFARSFGRAVENFPIDQLTGAAQADTTAADATQRELDLPSLDASISEVSHTPIFAPAEHGDLTAGELRWQCTTTFLHERGQMARRGKTASEGNLLH